MERIVQLGWISTIVPAMGRIYYSRNRDGIIYSSRTLVRDYLFSVQQRGRLFCGSLHLVAACTSYTSYTSDLHQSYR